MSLFVDGARMERTDRYVPLFLSIVQKYLTEACVLILVGTRRAHTDGLLPFVGLSAPVVC